MSTLLRGPFFVFPRPLSSPRPSSSKGAETTFRIGLTTHHPSRHDEFARQSVRPSAAFRLARWTALTPPASVSHARGDIPAAPASRGAAVGRTFMLNELR
jgi:hypothetical protein